MIYNNDIYKQENYYGMSPSLVSLFTTFTDNIVFRLYLYFSTFDGTIFTFY